VRAVLSLTTLWSGQLSTAVKEENFSTEKGIAAPQSPNKVFREKVMLVSK